MKKLNVIALSVLLMLSVASGTALSQTLPPQANYTGVLVESVILGNTVNLTLFNGKINNVQYADGTTANANTMGIETIIGVPPSPTTGLGMLRINNFTVPLADCDNTATSIPFTGAATIEITDPNNPFNYLTASLPVTFHKVGSTWSLHPAGFIPDPNDPLTMNLTIDNPTNTGPGNESRFITELEASLASDRLAGMTMVLTPIQGNLCTGGIFNAQGILYKAPAAATIEGTVFHDLNENGVQDLPGEEGIPNISVFIDDGVDVIEVITDENGHYSTTVSPDTYDVTVDIDDADLPAGITPSTAIQETVTVNTFEIAEVDFGFAPSGNPMNELGSLLVWPLIDNINYTTIINIANTGNKSIRLECYAVTIGPDGGSDQKIDWIINESPKEKFWWNTAVGRTHTNVDGNLTKIPSLDNRSGYIFCLAIGSKPVNDVPSASSGGYGYSGRYEKDYDYLKGNATLFDGTRAFNYNAIPSKAHTIKPDRILNLDGAEYSMASSQIMIEGFAEGAFGLIDGTIAAVNIGIDFIKSEQPEFDINVWCWNEDEVPFSVHLHYKDWEHYTLGDFNATRFNLGTDAFHCATTSTHAIWAVFYQTAGNMAYGGNVWHHPDTKVPTKVKLPEVPMSN